MPTAKKVAAAAKKVATPRVAANATAQKTTGTKLDGSPLPDPMPESVTLTQPYGFADDDGNVLSWSVGQVVTDTDDVLVLVERGAPIEPTHEQAQDETEV